MTLNPGIAGEWMKIVRFSSIAAAQVPFGARPAVSNEIAGFVPECQKDFFSFPSRSRSLPCCGLKNGMTGRTARLFAQTEFCLRKHIRRQRPFFSGANIFDDMGRIARADDHRADALLGQGKTQQKIVQILPGIKEF